MNVVARVHLDPVHIICRCRAETKKGKILRVRCWETIADKLSKTGWSLGWVSAVDSEGRTAWIVDAQRDNGKRLVVRADEKVTVFLELESAIFRLHRFCLTNGHNFFKTRRHYADLSQAEDISPAGFFASSGP